MVRSVSRGCVSEEGRAGEKIGSSVVLSRFGRDGGFRRSAVADVASLGRAGADAAERHAIGAGTDRHRASAIDGGMA